MGRWRRRGRNPLGCPSLRSVSRNPEVVCHPLQSISEGSDFPRREAGQRPIGFREGQRQNAREHPSTFGCQRDRKAAAVALSLPPDDKSRALHQPKRAGERGAVDRCQIGKPPHGRAGMFIQHGEDPPAGIIETVGAKTRIDRPRAPREDLTEMEEEMILEPKGPDPLSFPARARAPALFLRRPSTRAQIRLTCTYYASLCRNGNRRKTGKVERCAPRE